MRFVSKYPRLGIGAYQTELFVLAVDGQRDKTRDSISVMFTQEDLYQEDLAFALARWDEKEFSGRWLDADGVTLQPVAERIGVFDTEKQGWDDDLRRKVEAWMLAKPNYGNDFLQVEALPAGAPWQTYDSTPAAKIAPAAQALGLVTEALAYENENKRRPTVVAALEAAAEKTEVAPPEGELVNA